MRVNLHSIRCPRRKQIHGGCKPAPYFHPAGALRLLCRHVTDAYVHQSPALDMFDQMPQRAAVSWRDGGAERVQSIGRDLDETALISFLSACTRSGSLEAAKQAHCLAIKRGIEGFSSVGCSLLDVYSSCLDIRSTRLLFESLSSSTNFLLWSSPMLVRLVQCNLMCEASEFLQRMPRPRSVFAWTALISGYSQSLREPWKALALFVLMQDVDGMPPNEFTYDSVLRACAKLQNFDFGRMIHGCLVQTGLESECSITGALINLYCCCDAMDEAIRVYINSDTRFSSTSNAMIRGLVSAGRVDDAEMVFRRAEKRDATTYNLMIKGYALQGRMRDCKSMFETMPCRNIVSMNTMMLAMQENGELDECVKIFEQIKDENNVISWNSMISAYVRSDMLSEALKLYATMHKLSIGCTESTFAILFRACAGIGALQQGRMLHAHLCRTPLFESNVYVDTSLIDMYAKCGCVADARAVFEHITSPNVASWTSLINGLAHHNHGLEAIAQFARMLKRRVTPNAVTFVSLLMASARAGMASKGLRFFDAMKHYGLSPTVEHFACVVNLLGRSGRAREAKEFVMTMPMKPDDIVWGALLTACCHSMDLELSHRVAEKLVCMGTMLTSAYVALSNVHAKLGNWERVSLARKRLRGLNEKKDPGCSWIELTCVVHAFSVEDRNHPEREEIYVMLEDLLANISDYSQRIAIQDDCCNEPLSALDFL